MRIIKFIHKNLRTLSYSVSAGILVTSLATLFKNEGGYRILEPGGFLQMLLQLFFMVIDKDDKWVIVPQEFAVPFNVIFWSLVTFVFLLMLKARKLSV